MLTFYVVFVIKLTCHSSRKKNIKKINIKFYTVLSFLPFLFFKKNKYKYKYKYCKIKLLLDN